MSGTRGRRCYRRPAPGGLAQLGERRLCKAEVTGSIPVSSTGLRARHEHRSLLAAARRRRPFRPDERAGLRGHGRPAGAAGGARPVPLGARGARGRGTLRDRDDARPPRRRRGSRRRGGGGRRGARRRAVPALPVRGPPVARRDHPRRRGGGREPATAQRRPRPRATAARARAAGADAGVGSRRAARRRDVEFELADLVVDRAERRRGRGGGAAGRRPRAGVGGGPGRGRDAGRPAARRV